MSLASVCGMFLLFQKGTKAEVSHYTRAVRTFYLQHNDGIFPQEHLQKYLSTSRKWDVILFEDDLLNHVKKVFAVILSQETYF